MQFVFQILNTLLLNRISCMTIRAIAKLNNYITSRNLIRKATSTYCYYAKKEASLCVLYKDMGAYVAINRYTINIRFNGSKLIAHICTRSYWVSTLCIVCFQSRLGEELLCFYIRYLIMLGHKKVCVALNIFLLFQSLKV